MNVPLTLYYASHQKLDRISPGFIASQEVNETIKGRTNEWIYATTDPNTAIVEALEFAIRERWKVESFKVDDMEISVDLKVHSGPMTQHTVQGMIVLLYTINVRNQRIWESIEENGELFWRTRSAVDSIRGRRLISMYDWLLDRSLRIHHPRYR